MHPECNLQPLDLRLRPLESGDIGCMLLIESSVRGTKRVLHVRRLAQGRLGLTAPLLRLLQLPSHLGQLRLETGATLVCYLRGSAGKGERECGSRVRSSVRTLGVGGQWDARDAGPHTLVDLSACPST